MDHAASSHDAGLRRACLPSASWVPSADGGMCAALWVHVPVGCHRRCQPIGAAPMSAHGTGCAPRPASGRDDPGEPRARRARALPDRDVRWPSRCRPAQRRVQALPRGHRRRVARLAVPPIVHRPRVRSGRCHARRQPIWSEGQVIQPARQRSKSIGPGPMAVDCAQLQANRRAHARSRDLGSWPDPVPILSRS